jgi:hypothetical protein
MRPIGGTQRKQSSTSITGIVGMSRAKSGHGSPAVQGYAASVVATVLRRNPAIHEHFAEIRNDLHADHRVRAAVSGLPWRVPPVARPKLQSISDPLHATTPSATHASTCRPQHDGRFDLRTAPRHHAVVQSPQRHRSHIRRRTRDATRAANGSRALTSNKTCRTEFVATR